MRKEYEKASLELHDLQKDPNDLLKKWWHEASNANDPMLDAVYLSTVNQDEPDARIVLLKGIDQGFTFFTNYQSAKALELEKNPKACLVLFWPSLERQVRIKGLVKKTSQSESEAYFKNRPRGAQIGAWASSQSMPIKDRDCLEEKVLELEKQYLNQEIPCPPHWGGFRLTPYYFEFWQGRPDRLHDRFCYKLKGDSYSIERLAP